MRYKQMKRNEIEIDDLNIKSHLNASLEAEGISISEDLINRTLKAIKQQEAENLDTDKRYKENEKPISFYRNIRTLITVAAAALILVAGLNAIKLFAPKMKMESKSDNSVSYDSGSKEMYLTSERVRDVVSEEMKSEPAVDDALIEEDTADYDQTLDILMKADQKMDEEETGGQDKAPSNVISLTFSDIIVIEPIDVITISITSVITGETRTITDRGQIDDIYSVMDNYLFTNSMNDDDAQYIIKLIGEDKDSQIIIGEASITVDNTLGDITSHSIYSTADHESLINDIKERLE